MLVELLISCRYAHNVGGFGLQFFKRIQPYFYQNNDKCLTFSCQNNQRLKYTRCFSRTKKKGKCVKLDKRDG